MPTQLRLALLLSASLLATPAAVPVPKPSPADRSQGNARRLDGAGPARVGWSGSTSELDAIKGFDGSNLDGFGHLNHFDGFNPDRWSAKSWALKPRSWSSWIDDVKFDLKYRTKETLAHYLGNVLIVLLVMYCLISLVRPYGADVSAFWRRRRMAAKYKRVKKSESEADAMSASEEEVGLFEMVASSLTADKYLDCVVDLGDAKPARTCSVDVADLEKTSELVFKLADGLKASGDVELGAVSLVDLYLKDRVRLEYTASSGETKLVGKASVTTPDMLRNAKSFRVTILPQATR